MYLELDQKDCMSTAIIDSNGSQVTYGELMCFAQEFKKVIGKRTLIFVLSRNCISHFGMINTKGTGDVDEWN